MSGHLDDTICALATPVGEGGIGIVRLSGCKALDTASALVRLRSGKLLSSARSHALQHADLLLAPSTSDQPSAPFLDEALVVVMRAPHSYTGEDVVEFHCHGGPFVLQTLCEALLRHGARMAEPGEFSKRAFLNGRLDLTQAEAVLDTIRARTAGSLRIAQAQLRGTLSKEIDQIRESLIGLLAHVEAAIDFTEEDLIFVQPDELTGGVQAASTAIARLIQTCDEGRILREGITVAIVGRPNVGKSSLLNALLSTDRAIVTPIPGTTRDVLEEAVNIRGVPMQLLDTAGVRETVDVVEQEGLRRTRLAIEDAELLLILLDGSSPLTDDDRTLLVDQREKKRLVVINKSDLPAGLAASDLAAVESPIRISAKTSAGLDELRDRMRHAVLRSDFEPGETAVVTRLRHRASLLKAQDSLSSASSSVASRLSGEFIAMDLRAGIDALGEITGAVTTEDILDRIFRDFCIGK
jgi:tRNA modification GTPase